MKDSNSRYIGFSILATIMWPVLGLFFAFIVKRKIAFIFLLISATWYGLTFPFSNPDLDSWRYAEDLSEMKGLNLKQFLDVYIYGYLRHENALDLYQPVVTFLLAKLDASKELMFTFFALVVFILQYLCYVQIKKISGEKSIFFFFMSLAILFLCVPIFYINGVRFYTACWFFILGCIGFYLSNKKTALFFVLFSPLVHFSFIIFVLIFPFLKLTKQFGKNKVIALILISFTLGNWVLGFISNIILSGGGGGVNDKAARYVNEDYVELVDNSATQANIIVSLGGNLLYYLLIAILLYLTARKYQYFYKHKALITLWAITSSCLIFSLLTSSIPSMGRFNVIFEVLCLIFILLYYSHKRQGFVKNNRREKFIFPVMFIILLPALILRLVVVIRLAIEVTGVQFLIPIVFSPILDNYSIYSFYKS